MTVCPGRPSESSLDPSVPCVPWAGSAGPLFVVQDATHSACVGLRLSYGAGQWHDRIVSDDGVAIPTRAPTRSQGVIQAIHIPFSPSSVMAVGLAKLGLMMAESVWISLLG